jgi:hypothetical protein
MNSACPVLICVAAEMKFVRTAGYTHLFCKNNLGTMKELNTQPITEITDNYRSNWKKRKMLFEFPAQNPTPCYLLATKWKKIFGKTLHTLT